jgi:hypothetical protein
MTFNKIKRSIRSDTPLACLYENGSVCRGAIYCAQNPHQFRYRPYGLCLVNGLIRIIRLVEADTSRRNETAF